MHCLRASESSYKLQTADDIFAKVILRGNFYAVEFFSGFRIHATDDVERENAETAIVLAPALTVSILLEGGIAAAIGHRRVDQVADVGPVGKI